MTTVTVTEAKARLNELVEQAEATHEQVVITRYGRPSAVLIAADDLDSLQETLFWLSQPGIRNDLAEARLAIETGETATTNEFRGQLNLPR